MQVKKGLSLVLSLVLVAQLCLPVGAVMANANPGAGEIVCTHHAAHTPDCGYTEGAVCTHAHTESCGTNGESCVHTYDAACEHTAGTPCTFDPSTCPDCNPAAVDPTAPESRRGYLWDSTQTGAYCRICRVRDSCNVAGAIQK